MDDVRAVMDAAGAERAAVVGVSEGGPMCTLFAATHPDRTLALVTMGSYARRNWAPDYPIGRRAEQDGWLRPTAEQWGRYAARRFLERARAVDRRRRGGDRVVRVLPRARREPVGGGGDHRHERGDRRPPRAADRARPVARPLPRGRVPARGEPLHGRAAAGRAGGRGPGRRPPALGGRPGRPCSTRSSAFLGGLRDAAAEPEPVLTTVLDADLPESERGLAALDARALPRAGARRRPPGRVRASFDGPARAVRCATRARRQRPARCAPACTRASASCATAGSAGAALEIAAGVAGTAAPARSSPPRRCRTSSPAPGSTSPSAAPSTCSSPAPSSEWRLFSVDRNIKGQSL